MKNYDERLLKGMIDSNRAYVGPKIAQVDLTGFCDNNCIGCWVHSPFVKNPPKDKNVCLPYETAEKLINDLASLGTEEIFLSGAGEPFLYPKIFEILGLIKKRGMKCNIITGFPLRDREKIASLIDLEIDLITVSVWAGTPDTYLKTHPNRQRKDFDSLKESLRTIVKLRDDRGACFPRLKIYNVICNMNCREIGQMIDLGKELGVNAVEFQVMDIIAGATSFLALTEDDVGRVKSQFKALEKREDLFFREIDPYDFPSSSEKTTGEIVKEFPGRFLSVPSDFSVEEIGLKDKSGENCSLRIATCPKGIKPKPTEANPLYAEDKNLLIFEFPRSICKNCSLFMNSCPVDKDSRLPVKFLRILGYGSFARRLNSKDIYDRSYDREILNKIPCFAGWMYTRVLSTGEVIPCCKAYRFPLGELKERSFSDIWFSRAYNVFREKSKNEEKTDKYFSLIDCHKCCDNLGMNLAAQEMLGGDISTEDIIIYADSFFSGNFNTGHHFGKRMIIDGGAAEGYAQYKVNFPHSGKYSLWSCYASGLPRSVDIFLDGAVIKTNALNRITGGWDESSLRWNEEAVLDVRRGERILKIYSDKLIPHIRAFALKRGSKKAVAPSIKEESGESAAPRTEGRRTRAEFLSGGAFGGMLKREKIKENYLKILGICNGRYAFQGPFHVQIDLTNECNNNCVGCWCNSPLLGEKALSLNEKKQILPRGLVKDLLDELAAMGTREIYYSGGGEPFTHPDIMEILEYSKRKGFVCYVNTNFTLLDRRKIRQLMDFGVDHLTVSIWASNPRTYVLTHPNKNEEDFRRIKENLRFLNAHKPSVPYVKLYNVIFNLNYREIEEMIGLARETNAESVEFTVIDTIPDKTDKLLLDDCQCRRLYENCLRIKAKLERGEYLNGVRLFHFDHFLRRISSPDDLKRATYDRSVIDTMPCYIGWLFARVMPDGNINSCLKSHRVPVANLFRDSFADIWNGKKQGDFRVKTLVCEKNDPFFRLIGNDPEIQEAGCYKSCDDIGRNLFMHRKMKLLPLPLKKILKIASKVKRHSPGKKEETVFENDLTVKGIRDGRKAFAGPEQVVVDLTNRCDKSCLGCWLYSPLLENKSFSPDWLREELDTNLVKKLIDDLADMGAKIIRFTGGGEPTLHPAIMDLLGYVKKKGLKCALTTNFSPLNREKIKGVAAMGIDELAVSLWAADEKTYLRVHPKAKQGEFTRIGENLKFLNGVKAERPAVTLCNVIGSFNYDRLVGMYDFASEVRADSVYFTLVDSIDGRVSDLLLTEEQKRIVLAQADEIEKMRGDPNRTHDVNLDYFAGFIRRLRQKEGLNARYDREAVNEIPCYVGWTFSRILADATVVPCCRAVKLPMGNLRDQSFKEIWSSKRYKEFRSRAKHLSKSHPFFANIGCEKMCDNLMHNQQTHRRLENTAG